MGLSLFYFECLPFLFFVAMLHSAVVARSLCVCICLTLSFIIVFPSFVRFDRFSLLVRRKKNKKNFFTCSPSSKHSPPRPESFDDHYYYYFSVLCFFQRIVELLLHFNPISSREASSSSQTTTLHITRREFSRYGRMRKSNMYWLFINSARSTKQ